MITIVYELRKDISLKKKLKIKLTNKPNGNINNACSKPAFEKILSPF